MKRSHFPSLRVQRQLPSGGECPQGQGGSGGLEVMPRCRSQHYDQIHHRREYDEAIPTAVKTTTHRYFHGSGSKMMQVNSAVMGSLQSQGPTDW
jgi:hypothetical protein